MPTTASSESFSLAIHTDFNMLSAADVSGDATVIFYGQKSGRTTPARHISCARLSPAAGAPGKTVAEIHTLNSGLGRTDIKIVRLAAPIDEVKRAYQTFDSLPVVDKTPNRIRELAQKALSWCGLSLTKRSAQGTPQRPTQNYEYAVRQHDLTQR